MQKGEHSSNTHSHRRVSNRIIKEISTVLSADQILTAPDAIAAYRRFRWLPGPSRVPLDISIGPPAAIILPRTADDVAQVLRCASALKVPVVPYSGGTGVMGGAAPVADGIVLDMGTMNRVLDIDPLNQVAIVEPGVVLDDLARAAEVEHLLFAHDPWSQPIATVGGAIGTNGMGYLAAGYGSMGQQVRGLDVVLANGEIIAWAGAAKSVGPELWRTFIGAEGTLGVITRAVIQLFSPPEVRRFAAYRFPRFATGFAAIVALRQAGLRPSMIDYEEIEESDGSPLGVPADLFLAFDGPATVTEASTFLARSVCLGHGATDLGDAAADQFWIRRHDSATWFLQRAEFPDLTVAGPRSSYLNVDVPTTRVLDYFAAVAEIAGRHGVAVRSFGVWARPELVSFILEGDSGGNTAGPLENAVDEALRLARQEGGSIEYCHGAGLRLAHLVPEEMGSAFALLRQIKSTLDPAGILNPGKLGLAGAPARQPPIRR